MRTVIVAFLAFHSQHFLLLVRCFGWCSGGGVGDRFSQSFLRNVCSSITTFLSVSQDEVHKFGDMIRSISLILEAIEKKGDVDEVRFIHISRHLRFICSQVSEDTRQTVEVVFIVIVVHMWTRFIFEIAQFVNPVIEVDRVIFIEFIRGFVASSKKVEVFGLVEGQGGVGKANRGAIDEHSVDVVVTDITKGEARHLHETGERMARGWLKSAQKILLASEKLILIPKNKCVKVGKQRPRKLDFTKNTQ